MADKRISQLIERTDIANNDVLPIVASGATTTNKVTVSTLQDWMQDNLDVGVTSVGITLGTTGTDVNVSGSPITTSGNITINIPDASATARGVVTTGSQNFAGNKSFQNTIFVNAGLRLDQNGTALPTFVQNISGTGLISSGSNGLGFNSANNLYFSGSEKGGAVLAVNNTAVRTYTLQDANGTLAFTSDLTGYVTLDTAQTITATKTFTTSGSGNTINVNHTSGSGHGVEITKAGNGEGLRVIKTSGSGNAVTITGGTLSAEAGQFSGDLQTSTRISATSGSNAITITPNVGGTQNRIETTGTLPLSLVSAAAITLAAGGTTPQITLATTGAVTFTNNIQAKKGTFGTTGISTPSLSVSDNDQSNVRLRLQNTTSGNAWDLVGGLNGANNSDFSIYDVANNVTALRIVPSTGAATFSSSVTANGLHANAGNSARFYRNTNDAYWGVFNDSNNYLNFGTFLANGTAYGTNPKLILLDNGNVGIGTASPAQLLHLSKSDGVNDVGAVIQQTANFTAAFLRITANNDAGAGYNSIVSNTNGGTEHWRISGEASSSTFAVRTGGTERMRITSGGFTKASNNGTYLNATGSYHELRTNTNLNQIVTFNSSASTPYGIHITYSGASPNTTDNEFIYCADSTESKFIVWSNGNVINRNNSYGSFSDIKIKENITDATPKLNDLLKVKVRNYNLIGEHTKQIGVIAQELEEVFPAMIDESEDFEEAEVPQLDDEGNEVLNEEGEVVNTKERVSKGTTTKSVKYSVFVPMLIKAIQELKTEIDSLKNQIK